MIMVKAEDIDKEGVLSGYEMTLYDLGDLLERLDDFRILVGF